MPNQRKDKEMKSKKVAQIGVGAIGSIYAEHLVNAGTALTIFDRNAARLAAVVKLGARPARSIAEAVGDAEYILVSLPEPTAVREAYLSPGGIVESARKSTVILDLSTVDPETAQEIERNAKQRGLLYLEAPVSGGEPLSAGTDGARNGNVTFMAGGDAQAFEAALPLMRVLGKHPLHLGPEGTGATVKLISNYIAGLHNLVAAEAFALGAAAGISNETLLKTFSHTDANSFWLFNYFAPRIQRGDFVPGFSVDLQYKDLRLCEDLARKYKVSMPLNGVALQIYQILRGTGRGGRDLVDAANLFLEFAGLRRTRSQRGGAEK
jgi:3-hydroxyisobutyrate dehydrogenase-like beta-hydroxyacid dehydrogenase